MTRPPEPDQLEINVFGPGYGESCVMHLGAGRWVIIDSCLNSETQKPAALDYLDQIGVDPSSSVELIIATHWHDDHIAGISSIVEMCKSARFCASAALNTAEFIATLTAYDQKNGAVAGSGASEIVATLDVLKQRTRSRPAIRALPNRCLLTVSAGESGHGFPVNVWSLSPSDAQFDAFLQEIGNLAPAINVTKRRAPLQRPNHLSVVTCICVGELSFLFGADLEEVGNPDFGWSAIVASQERPKAKSLFFKIPHHGSETGHHTETWAELLEPTPYAVLTPWNRSRALPTIPDVERIQAYTDRGYSTSNLQPVAQKRRIASVEKQIRETTLQFRNVQLRTGHVQLRNQGMKDPNEWTVTLSSGACLLTELLAALRARETSRSKASPRR